VFENIDFKLFVVFRYRTAVGKWQSGI